MTRYLLLASLAAVVLPWLMPAPAVAQSPPAVEDPGELVWELFHLDAEAILFMHHSLNDLVLICGPDDAELCLEPHPAGVRLVSVAIDHDAGRVLVSGRADEVAELGELFALLE